MSNRKKKTEEERMIEAEGAKIFGKHVSKEKGRGLLVASLLACALPMVGKKGAELLFIQDFNAQFLAFSELFCSALVAGKKK